MSKPLQVVPYLNQLSKGERLLWYKRMVKDMSLRRSIQPDVLAGSSIDCLKRLTNPLHPELTGQDWLDLLACETKQGKQQSSHQRWQPRTDHRGNSFPDGAQMKVFTHVLSFAAHNDEPLPENLGKGSSIDHRCGQQGCSRVEHLALAHEHRDNVARIGCLGVTLIVANDVIIWMFPCPHGTGVGAARLLTGCLKVRLLQLPTEAVNVLKTSQ